MRPRLSQEKNLISPATGKAIPGQLRSWTTSSECLHSSGDLLFVADVSEWFDGSHALVIIYDGCTGHWQPEYVERNSAILSGPTNNA